MDGRVKIFARYLYAHLGLFIFCKRWNDSCCGYRMIWDEQPKIHFHVKAVAFVDVDLFVYIFAVSETIWKFAYIFQAYMLAKCNNTLTI